MYQIYQYHTLAWLVHLLKDHIPDGSRPRDPKSKVTDCQKHTNFFEAHGQKKYARQ